MTISQAKSRVALVAAFAAALFWTIVAVRRDDAVVETIMAVIAWIAFVGLAVGQFLWRMTDTRQQ